MIRGSITQLDKRQLSLNNVTKMKICYTFSDESDLPTTCDLLTKHRVILASFVTGCQQCAQISILLDKTICTWVPTLSSNLIDSKEHCALSV